MIACYVRWPNGVHTIAFADNLPELFELLDQDGDPSAARYAVLPDPAFALDARMDASGGYDLALGYEQSYELLTTHARLPDSDLIGAEELSDFVAGFMSEAVLPRAEKPVRYFQAQPPPVRQTYRARVRLSGITPAGTPPAWTDVEAFTAAEAACAILAVGQSPTTSAGGRIPVEVTKRGSVSVQRFQVEYRIQYEAYEEPPPPARGQA